MLANSSHSVDDLGFHLLDTRFELPRVRQRTGSGKSIRRSTTSMSAVTSWRGTFSSLSAAMRSACSSRSRGQQRFEVFPESETRFFLRAVEAQVSFGRDASGAVDHLIVHQNGADQRAVRLAEGVDSVDYGPAETVSVPEETLQRYVGPLRAPARFLDHRDSCGRAAVRTGDWPIESRDLPYVPKRSSSTGSSTPALTFQTDAGGAATSLVLRPGGSRVRSAGSSRTSTRCPRVRSASVPVRPVVVLEVDAAKAQGSQR